MNPQPEQQQEAPPDETGYNPGHGNGSASHVEEIHPHEDSKCKLLK